MADLVVALPEPHPQDDEDVVWGLSTATALWARGEHRDAIVWLRRAMEAAEAAGQAFRASEIGLYVSALEQSLEAGTARAAYAPASEVARDRIDTLIDPEIVNEDTPTWQIQIAPSVQEALSTQSAQLPYAQPFPAPPGMPHLPAPPVSQPAPAYAPSAEYAPPAPYQAPSQPPLGQYGASYAPPGQPAATTTPFPPQAQPVSG